jgi:hypothetical protein
MQSAGSQRLAPNMKLTAANLQEGILNITIPKHTTIPGLSLVGEIWLSELQ